MQEREEPKPVVLPRPCLAAKLHLIAECPEASTTPRSKRSTFHGTYMLNIAPNRPRRIGIKVTLEVWNATTYPDWNQGG
jgi:hypothetical protein